MPNTHLQTAPADPMPDLAKNIYKAGGEVPLPARSDGQDPDWRYAAFSVILPLPESIVPESRRGQFCTAHTGTQETPYAWQPGRFKGIGYFTTEPLDSELPWWHPGKDYFSYHEAKQRYDRTVADSLGGALLDADYGAKQNGGPPLDQDFCFQHIDLIRHFNTVHISRDRFGPKLQFPIEDEVGSGSLGMVAAELIQYSNSSLLTDANVARPVHRFLVIHIDAQDCSGKALRTIAQSVHRPRNPAPIATDDLPEKLRPKREGDKGPSVLRVFVHQFKQYFYVGDGDKPVNIWVTAGNFLGASKHRQSDRGKGEQQPESQGRLDRAAAGSTPAQGRRLKAIPTQHVAVAIPGGPTITELPSFHGADPTQQEANRQFAWTHAEQWAWALATGADRYEENRPNLYRDPADYGLTNRQKDWSVLISQEGLGLIRHLPPNALGMRPLNLASTRYVDLAILNLRAYDCLSELAGRLADERRADEHLFTPSGADDEARLKTRLERLQSIETGFVNLRDRLWFNAITRQPLDSEILSGLRGAIGLDELYRDFSDELATRREIYGTQHSIQSLEADRRLQEAERKSDRRNNRLNVWLAVVAIALGWPAIIDLFFREHGLAAGIWGASLPVLVAISAIVWPRLPARFRDRVGARLTAYFTQRDSSDPPTQLM